MGSIMSGLISWGKGISNQQVASDGNRFIRHLVELQQCPRCPLHPLVDDRDEVAHLALIWYIYLANSGERLLRGVEMLEEDNDHFGVFPLDFLHAYMSAMSLESGKSNPPQRDPGEYRDIAESDYFPVRP